MNDYFKTLETVGHRPLVLGGKIHLLPFSGRVLGLYPEPGLNTFWINPGLEQPESAAALLANPKWTNLGGDRTWISPEVELFIPDLAHPLDTYKVPDSFDPGNYRVVSQSEDAAELETTARLKFYRSNCTADFTLRKSIKTLDAPAFDLPAGITVAGYRQESRLASPAPLPEMIRPALWYLMQMPGPGEIIVPVKGQASSSAFFGKQRCRYESGCVHAAIPTTEEGYKFGIHADHCLGLMLYLQLDSARPFMVMRRFDVGNAYDYFDVPFTDIEKLGFLQQFYIDAGKYGGFGEMEYHSPALIHGIRNEVVDRNEVWAFSGPAEQLRTLCQRLLSQY